MLTDQCVSVTDLKKNMNAYVKDLKRDKIIFVNNMPVAVLMDVKKYEKMMQEGNFLNI
jgi:prevent-host-death family protein